MDKIVTSLAEYASACRYQDIPADTVAQCKFRIIDSIGCAGGAFAQPLMQTLRQFTQAYSGEPAARIWGTGSKTSVEMAAFVNGSTLRYLDLSDTYLGKSAGHPSDMIAALAASAEANKVDGPGLITSIIVAYEIYCGLADTVALQPHGLDQATLAAIGCAAGVGNQLGLSTEHMKHALSFAITSSIHLYNIRTGALSDWKSCAGPNGARNGVFAAQLAKAGVTAPSAAVEGNGGLFEVLEPFEWTVNDTVPRLVKTHLKLHPVCYHGQAPVDAILALRGRVSTNSISKITVETYDAAYRAMASDTEKWRPRTRETADHSLPYVIAITLLEGKLSIDSYNEVLFQDPSVKDLMDKVEVIADEAMTEAYPGKVQARITVEDTSGARYVHLQEYPKGHCENPMNRDEVEEKFRSLFGFFGPEDAASSLLEYVWSLESKDIVAIPF